MEHNGVFRKSLFGGFDQKAVLNYIEQLEQSKAQLQRQLQERENQKEACRQAEENLAKMEAEMVEKDAVITSLVQKNEELTLQLTEKMERIQRRECELESLQEQAAGMMEKSQMYSDVSGKIGDTLLQAQATADRIVEQAKRDQQNIRTQTTEMIQRTMDDIGALRVQLVSLRGQVGEALQALDVKIGGLVDSIDVAQRSFQGKKTFLDNRQKYERQAAQLMEKAGDLEQAPQETAPAPQEGPKESR